MRVVIAEDQVLLRDGVVRLLEGAGNAVVGQVGDARALVAAVNEHRPDLVIADIRMPPGYADEGARAVQYLRIRFPGLPVLILSQVVEPLIVGRMAGERAAAFGYLLKDRVLDTDQFLAQLQVVASGGTVIDPVVVARSVHAERGRLTTLTERELEVLQAVATGRSNPGIAADLFISRRTVEAHLRSIFQKLDIGADPNGNQRMLAALEWLGIAVFREPSRPE